MEMETEPKLILSKKLRNKIARPRKMKSVFLFVFIELPIKIQLIFGKYFWMKDFDHVFQDEIWSHVA